MDFIALALSLLQTVLASAKVGQAEQAVVQTIQDAMTKLLSVQGSDVTYQELESLRSTKTF